MKRSTFFASAALILGLVSTARAESRDLLIADFEGPDYGDWVATGDAFGAGPAHGTLPDQMAVTGFLGHGLVNTYLHGDAGRGTLTSPPIAIRRRYVNFLIGGGNQPNQTCINLLIDGKTVRTATGADSEHLDWETWDVSEFAGKSARIQIVDDATGGWGHINIDQIVQSDTPAVEPVVTEPLYAETHRPRFHFTAARNWLNDPNGLVFYRGEYHLFFQHNPSANVWGNMTWGHAVSPDLVHWSQLRNAIEPDKLGTVFSGSAVVDWNNTTGFGVGGEPPLVAMYTAAGNPFTQCLAYSTDGGRTWTKYEHNPVLPNVADGNRDPKLVRHEPTRQWVCALYKSGETYGLFSSPDLKTWKPLQDLNVPGCSECPDFFPMKLDGDAAQTKWIFTAANGKYLVGDFDGKRFTASGEPLQVDFGRNFYAVQSYSDIPASDGRRVQIAWMRDGVYPHMPFNQQMSFPCELTLHSTPAGPRLWRFPVKEIGTLHEKPVELASRPLEAGEHPIEGIDADVLDVRATFEPGKASEVGLVLRGQKIVYSVRDKMLSALGASAPLEPIDGRIELRILLDRTSIETFANGGRVSLTSCFVPSSKERRVATYCAGEGARFGGTIYPLRLSWERRQP